MRHLPAQWTRVPLRELVQTVRPRIDPRKADGLPFIGMDHIEPQTMRLLRTVPAATMKSAAVQFEPGDVLYGRLRPYLNKVFRPDFPGLGSAEFIALTPSARIDSGYLGYLLNSPAFVRFASALNTGDRPRVDFKQISDYPVPLPGLDEQRRVVECLEQQLTRIEASVGSLNAAQQRAELMSAAILNEAWRREPRSMFARLADLAWDSDYGTSQKATYDAVGWPIIRIPNVVDGHLELQDLKFATRPEDLRADQALRPGDFLIVRTNGSRELIGRAAVVEIDFARPHYHASYLIRFRLNGGMLLWRWLSLIWHAPAVRRQLESMAATSAGQYNLSLRSLGRLRVPIPPEDLFRDIVPHLEGRLSSVGELRGEIMRSLKRAARLREAVLNQAFSGQLS